MISNLNLEIIFTRDIMEVGSTLRYYRQSPKKVRLVVNLIKGKSVTAAQDLLKSLNKRASLAILKLLNSAIANAENNYGLSSDNLYIKEITVNEGPTLHRFRARAFGRAASIRKRSSHIMIKLAEIKESSKVGKRQAAPEAGLQDQSTGIDKSKIMKDEKGAAEKEEKRVGKQSAELKIKQSEKVAAKKVTPKEKEGIFKKVFRRKSI